MQFARINDITIHFRDEGPEDGVPVVFSNSLGTDFRIWDAMISAMKNRAPNKFRFIRYDKRGHGVSDAPPAPYLMDDHVDDLVALLDHLDVESAVVIGLSVGGLIAQGLADKSPHKIRALILSDTGHKIGDEELWDTRIMAIRESGIAAISKTILERWFSRNFRNSRKSEFAAYANMLVRTPLEGYLGTCAAIRNADMTRIAKAITLPTLLIVGSNDGSTPPELMAETHELISGSRFEIIDGPGHLPCIEKPEITAELVLDFLKENNIVEA